MRARVRLFLASSNPGKLSEYRALARTAELASPGEAAIALELLPGFDSLLAFEENAPTFAENAAGKALHASTIADEAVCADDSGLVVPTLGGEPGVQSARYAGAGASGAENIAKLLSALRGKSGPYRDGYFVCALAVARKGRVLAVVTNRVDGQLLEAPRGSGGFGYDPIFFFAKLGKTFADISSEEKNLYSHRGKAFRRLLEVLPGML